MFRRTNVECSISDRQTIATNGNRYDVNLVERRRTPVYWDDEPNEVCRSKWFYLTERNNRYVPYNEQMNEILEVKRGETNSTETMVFLLPESLH